MFAQSSNTDIAMNNVPQYVPAGGITTLIDMPLNSFPSTVSEETLGLKVLIVDIVFFQPH